MTQENLLEKKPEKRFIGLNGNMWIYALGVMGINLAIGLVNSYQAEFFNKMMSIDLIAVAIIILVAKFVSIFADFIFGNLIDRAHFKSGKMRPWILMSAFPLAALTMLSFVFIPFPATEAGKIGKYVYIAFVLILWNVSMTMADIPSQGMLSFVTDNANDTNNAAGWANTLKSLALACSGVVFTIVGMLTGSGGVLTQKEYLITAGILVGLGLVFQLLMYFKTREINKSAAPAGMSFKEMFHELKGNKQMMILFATFILGFGRNIGLGIAVQASCILIREGIDLSFIGMGVLRGDQCSWAIGITSAISSAIFIVLNPIINKKLGEKKYFIIAGFYGFIVATLSYILYVFGGAPMRSIWAILVYQLFMGISFAPNGYLPMVMTADIVDYQEWRTGKRTEGTQFAILSMSNKLSNALSVSMGLLLIGAIGYSSDKYFGAVEAGGDIAAYVTNSMQNKAWAIYFLLPGLCMLASSLIMFFYKIDEKTKVEMRAALAVKHAKERGETPDEDESAKQIERAEEAVFEGESESEIQIEEALSTPTVSVYEAEAALSSQAPSDLDGSSAIFPELSDSAPETETTQDAPIEDDSIEKAQSEDATESPAEETDNAKTEEPIE